MKFNSHTKENTPITVLRICVDKRISSCVRSFIRNPTRNPLADASLPRELEEVRETAHKLSSLNHVNHKKSHRSVITLSEGCVSLTWHMRIARVACQSGTAQLVHVQSQRNVAWSYGDLFLNSTTFLNYQAVVQTLHAL